MTGSNSLAKIEVPVAAAAARQLINEIRQQREKERERICEGTAEYLSRWRRLPLIGRYFREYTPEWVSSNWPSLNSGLQAPIANVVLWRKGDEEAAIRISALCSATCESKIMLEPKDMGAIADYIDGSRIRPKVLR